MVRELGVVIVSVDTVWIDVHRYGAELRNGVQHGVARSLSHSMRLVQGQAAARREQPADGAGARVSRVLLEPCLSLATEPSEIQCADALRRLAPHLLMR